MGFLVDSLLFCFVFFFFEYISPCLLVFKFSNENSACNFIEDNVYIPNCFYLVFKILSLGLTFKSLTIMFLSVGLFEFILFGVYLDSCMFILLSFIKFEKFVTTYSNILSNPFLSIFSFEDSQ